MAHPLLAGLAVGDEIPTYERDAGFPAWNRYAAVNHEFIPIHMDDAAGRKAGYPGAFGMGNLQWAYLHCLLRRWAGEDGSRIVALQCQFRGPSLQGTRTVAHGRITAVREEGGETLVDLEVWTETTEGTVMTPGRATVALPA